MQAWCTRIIECWVVSHIYMGVNQICAATQLVWVNTPSVLHEACRQLVVLEGRMGAEREGCMVAA
jgi:hypothetical protein